MSKGLFLLSEDGSQVRWFFFSTTTKTTKVDDWWNSSTPNENYDNYASPNSGNESLLENYNSLKFGTSITSLFNVPKKDDETVTFNVLWQNTTSVPIRYIKVTIDHTSGNDYYKCSVELLDENKTTITGTMYAYLFCRDVTPQYMLGPSREYIYTSFTLFIAPLTDDISDSFMFGFLRGHKLGTDNETQFYDYTMYRNGAGKKSTSWFYNYTGAAYPLSWYLGMLKDTPSYPSGGVEPTDVFGGDENNFDTTSDDISVPSPITGAIDNGLVKTYLISPTQLNIMMNHLTDFNNTSLKDFLDNIAMLYNNPIDAIISIKKFCIDFSEVPIGSAQNVFLLTYDTQATANPITAQYGRIDVGSIDIAEFFGGFLDYPPYTRCSIYLPFIGEKELNVQEIMGSTIHLYYMVDFLTGNCVAHLNVEKSAGETNLNSDLYQWEGNMACDVPLTGTDFHEMAGNALGNVFSGISNAMTGNIGGYFTNLGSSFGAANTGKVMSGAISGSSALMGVRVPYIKIENPIQTVPDNFQDLRGLAGNINHVIGDLSGFLRCREVDINNITATDDEKAELYALLTGGVYV